MTGFVLHPGHHELHGVTVVVEMASGITHVARFDTQDERGIHLLNVGTHDPASSAMSLEEYLARTRKFGVKAERKHLVVPAADVVRIETLVPRPAGA
jgi:hypothetical protein